MVCAYCNREKEALEAKEPKYKFTQEHILPSSLIGKPENNPFTLNNICGVCNSHAGLHIDAPAVRGWFMQAHMAMYAFDYAKVEETPILPLTFWGRIKAFDYEDNICELWKGPAGDFIYHFHKPYALREEFPPVVGKPPYLKKKDVDSGFVFIYVYSNNPAWYPTIARSLKNKFPDSPLYFGNGDKTDTDIFSKIPSELSELHTLLDSNKDGQVDFSFEANSENRFLAKAALGIGAKFLGDNFIQSQEAQMLRNYMWAKTHEERDKIPMHGTNFFKPGQDSTETLEMFGWEGGHVITLLNLGDCVSLTITLYNKLAATVKIEKTKFDYKDMIGDGISILIIPSLNKTFGPMKYIHFINHKLSMRRINPELTEIELELKKIKDNRPPVKI
ncbi:MAG: hypothetical protein JNJ41_02455 [Bacteroidia bacterium]|nr:hypothetical protein [Bacteroidia bacterium]